MADVEVVHFVQKIARKLTVSLYEFQASGIPVPSTLCSKL